VTNWYDALGRVVQQANANGAVSNLYFAGSRTEIVDALGDRRVTYQDERGLVMTAASVLDSNLGPVFSDTPQSDGAVDVTTKAYDELGRQVSTTLPGGDGSVIAYDGVVNPWANNLASVTRTPKPGSGWRRWSPAIPAIPPGTSRCRPPTRAARSASTPTIG